MINVFQPTLGDEELDAVREVYRSAWIGRGPRTKEFEREFAEHLGSGPEHVTAVNSCTEGLFMAMSLLDVKEDSEVVLPTISFVGAANAIAAQGARPVFCDVDPHSLNPTVDDVERRITSRTRAVMVLHYGGHPGSVADIAQLCRSRGIALVEDTACGVASSVDGTACGTLGDIGVWSFDAMKILVTGDGGMIWCRDPSLTTLAGKIGYLGMEQGSGFAAAAGGSSQRWWEFDVSSFSRRSILNDVTAAVGSVQLRRLPSFVASRAAVAARYDSAFASLGALRRPPDLPDGHRSSHLFYWIQLPPGCRDAVARRLYDRGVYTTFRYLPLHLLPIYAAGERLPGAEDAAERTLCIPMHQGLDDAAVDTVIAEVTDAVQALA
jgi:aminotransferase